MPPHVMGLSGVVDCGEVEWTDLYATGATEVTVATRAADVGHVVCDLSGRECGEWLTLQQSRKRERKKRGGWDHAMTEGFGGEGARMLAAAFALASGATTD